MAPPPPHTRFYAGAMTGTSLDGVDAAVIRVDGHGVQATGEIVATHSGPLDVPELHDLSRGAPLPAATWGAATETLSRCIADVLEEATADFALDGTVVHGQTLFHQAPCSVQIVEGAHIAHRLQCPVATHLRAGDLAAGGRGAPITPLGDWMLWRSNQPVCIINLGGFCNITWLPDTGCIEDIRGADICPCNLLLNEIARQFFNAPLDQDGNHAGEGTVLPHPHTDLRERLVHLSRANRSLGTTDECFDWLHTITGERPEDIAATAADAIGTTIAQAARQHPCTTIKLAGGGIHHRVLVNSIRSASDLHIEVSNPQDPFHSYREAACLAALGALHHDGVPPTLPAVTGRRAGTMIGFQWCQPC